MIFFRRSKFSIAGFAGSGLIGITCINTLLSPFQTHAGQDTDESINAGTLSYHLSTNAAGRAEGRTGGYPDMLEISAPNSTGLDRLTNAVWSQTFWLKGVQGLSATPIGYSNVLGGQGLVTMVSPRHYLCATHMHPEGYMIAFLDTNNVVHWRRTLQRVDVGNDISVGILNADLPRTVGFLPVLPANYTNYLSTDGSSLIQGVGMNQDMCLFGQPMTFGKGGFVNWDSSKTVSFGLAKNWNVTIRAGDSSNPEMLLIGNRLILVSHNYTVGSGPNYACQIPAINKSMHLLSTHNHIRTNYQLIEFPLTNWPAIH